MYQRDYILRMIEMMADFIAAVLKMLTKGDFSKASQMLENAYYDFLKKDAAFFRNIPAEKLTEELLLNHNYTAGHLEILAELFNAEAELAYKNGNLPYSLDFFQKTKLLLEFVMKESGTYSAEKEERIISLGNKIFKMKAN
jgi:hypothetical protein